VFDKTGTLTPGVPEVAAVVTAAGWGERDLLRLASSLEQQSGHLLARSTVKAALERGLQLQPPSHVTESAGRGVTGVVDGRAVRLIGITAMALTDAQQLTLFDGVDRTDRLSRSIDVVRKRFGERAITRARLLRERPSRRFDFGERPAAPSDSGPDGD